MHTKDKVISVRLSEPEYLTLVEVSKATGISEFVRTAIQRAILEGPGDEMKEATSLRLQLRTLIQAKGRIQDLFRLWKETGKVKYLLEIKSTRKEHPELRLDFEIDQALKAFAGD